MDPVVLAAIVTASVSLAITAVFTPLRDRFFYIYKLEHDYRYEQTKAIKGVLAKNKIQLLNSCEELVNRLLNLSINYGKGWQSREDYYFISFVYRFLKVCAWIKKTRDEMLFLDSTIAKKKDMEFIKFLRLMPQILTDVTLFDDFSYDRNEEKDHFFYNNLELYSQSIFKDREIMTYEEFEANFNCLKDKFSGVCQFINGISPNEERLRWERLQIFNITLMIFLNEFGYDFQKTTDDEFREIVNKPKANKMIKNYCKILKKHGLSNEKGVNRALNAILSTNPGENTVGENTP